MSEVCIDSGMGWNWSAIPSQKKENRNIKKADITWLVSKIILKHLFDKTLNESDKFDVFGEFGFYVKRLKQAPFYGLVQGRELIKMVCRCAFNDSRLTDNESAVIIEACHDPALDNILLEVNFNEGWS